MPLIQVSQSWCTVPCLHPEKFTKCRRFTGCALVECVLLFCVSCGYKHTLLCSPQLRALASSLLAPRLQLLDAGSPCHPSVKHLIRLTALKTLRMKMTADVQELNVALWQELRQLEDLSLSWLAEPSSDPRGLPWHQAYDYDAYWASEPSTEDLFTAKLKGLASLVELERLFLERVYCLDWSMSRLRQLRTLMLTKVEALEYWEPLLAATALEVLDIRDSSPFAACLTWLQCGG